MSAANASRVRIDEPNAPATAVLRNVLRFTSLIILLAACGCGVSRGDIDRRYRSGFETTMQILGEWLVPFPGTVEPAAWNPRPLWTSAASMAPETAGSRAAARTYFDRFVGNRELPPEFTEALIEYGSRRAVAKIVDREYFAVYRGREEARYFGGFVPRDLRLQIPVESAADRALLKLYTLERWVGRPVFDSIVLEFVKASPGAHPAGVADFVELASHVSGQDVWWLFDEMAGIKGRLDYAIDKFDSEADASGRFHTTVTVRRLGEAIVDRRIPVVTTFADGESVRENFHGRERQMTYEYRSQVRATTAEVDPDHVLMLDANRGNNGVTLDTGPARTAATRWSARWMIWLEDALLTYVAFT